MSRMRLCLLTENYPPQRGGMAQSCDRIVDGLRKVYTVDVIHFTNRNGSIQQIQQVNGSYCRIPFEDSEAHTLNITWNFLRGHSYDMLLCFGGYMPVLAAPVYAKWMGTPLLTLLRGNDFDVSIFTPRKRDLLKDVLLASQQICVVSQSKHQKIKQLFPDVNVSYVPNGIDVDSWRPSLSEQELAQRWRQEQVKGKICLGVFGQIKAKKGLAVLLQALLGMEEKESIHLLLIGDIAEEMQLTLQQSGIGYSHYSFMDRYELIRYYLCCDAVVIPSYYDGMPNVLLEACALGIPILASRIDGMQDVLSPVCDELLFEPGDERACRMVLSKFIGSNNQEKSKWSTLVKNRIETSFTSQQETKTYEKIIDTLLGRYEPALRLQSR